MPFDFDRIAEDFDSTRSSDPRLVDSVAMGLFDVLGKGSSILDIGTGTGRFLIPLENIGITGYGIDLSKKMLLRARAKDLDRLVLADALNLPFTDDQFDATLMTSVLHIVDDWKCVIREACRVSKRAVIAIDIGRDETNPHTVFKEIMKEKKIPIPKRGPFETELCDECPPERRVRITKYVEFQSRTKMLAPFKKRTYTYQADLDAKQNSDCVEEMAKKYKNDTISINWSVSLIVWNPDRLSKGVDRTTFCYLH